MRNIGKWPCHLPFAAGPGTFDFKHLKWFHQASPRCDDKSIELDSNVNAAQSTVYHI